MLEWYRAQGDYRDLADDCERLVLSVGRDLVGGGAIESRGRTMDLNPPWRRVAVREAFLAHAGWDPLGVEDPERFEEDLTEKVIPGLDDGKPFFLLDFPHYEASLAKRKPADPRVAERIELFAGGLELANGFSELTDPEEQRRRFEQANERRRARGERTYPLPERFLSFLPDLPPSAGIALGIDRLVMLFAGASHISEVIAIGPEDL